MASQSYGIEAIRPNDETHYLGFAAARSAGDNLFEIWNGSTDSAKEFEWEAEGRFRTKDGTVALPALAFIDDTDSGLYRIGANNLGIAVGGAKVADFGAAAIAFAQAVSIATGGLTITAGGLTVTAGGISVAAGTTAVQALTATTVSASSTLDVTGLSTFDDFLQGATANGYIHLRGDSGATGGLRVTDAPLFLFGHTVTTGGVANDAVLAHEAWLRAVRADGSTSYELIRLNSADEVQIGRSDRAINMLGNNVFFNNIGTTASAANAFLDGGSANNIKRSTSSLRYKNLLGDYSLDDARGLVMAARGIRYEPKEGGAEHVGLAAEAIHQIDQRFTTLDRKGRPDWVQYPHLVVPLMLVAQDHEARIAALEARLN